MLYRSERTVVRRLGTPDGSVIMKQALGPFASRRTRHESAILGRLAGLAGVPQLLPGGSDEILCMEDLGGVPLAELLDRRAVGPEVAGSDVSGWVSFAGSLVRILAAVHAAGVIHRDLNPANVLVARGPSGVLIPRLVDFDLATTFAQVRPGFVESDEIVGRLPYLAPEQTGRTGLPIDARSDLYSVGATMYEVLTGRPPVGDGDGDVLRVVTDILSVVPAPAGEVCADVPGPVSSIVSRLLSKEPDARYQSAVGLAHDLTSVSSDPDGDLELGSHDFPAVLSPPARAVGREAETGLLARALDRASSGEPGMPCVLVSGDPGVGKSLLIEQLRPLVSARGGWFVSGKADQFQEDARASVFVQALDALCQVHLTLPAAEIAAVRERVLQVLGDNAGLVCALVPSLRTLLGPSGNDLRVDTSLSGRARLTGAGIDLLTCLASPARPVVLFLDDIQWAGSRGMATMDALLATRARGVLLVAAFRGQEVDAAHPLSVMLERWARLDRPPERVPLAGLPNTAVRQLLAEMLRLPPRRSDELSRLLAERAGGNPYETIELINVLRADGVLALGDDGWRWDAQAVRTEVAASDLPEFLLRRLADLPDRTLRLVRAVACMGTGVPLPLLATAVAMSPADVAVHCEPALESGLVVAVDAEGSGLLGATTTLRFKHDRVQEAARRSMPAAGRDALVLELSRNLATGGKELEAAHLYLHVAAEITGPDEQRRVIGLLAGAADVARAAANPALVERCAGTALALHERSGGDEGAPQARALGAVLHRALYELGRLDEADAVFDRILRAAAGDPVSDTPAICIQMSSLTIRGAFPAALALGLDQLVRLGLDDPRGEPAAAADAVRAGYDGAEAWLRDVTLEQELARPEVTDPSATAAAVVIGTMCPTAFLSDHPLLGWLVVQAQRLWVALGPQPELVPCIGHSNSRSLGLRPDGDLDRRMVQRALAVGDARGYEPMTARARFVYGVVLAPSYEPVEEIIAWTRSAREVLRHHGDVQTDCYTYYVTAFDLVDAARSLDAVGEEVESGLALATRLGNATVGASLLLCRQFVRALRGETSHPDTFDEDGYDTAAHLSHLLTTNPNAAAHVHILSALRDLVLGDDAAVAAHTAALQPLLPAVAGTYHGIFADLLDGLAAVHDCRAGGAVPPEPMRRLDAACARLRAAAEDAPANFAHLATFLEAERAALVAGPDVWLVAAERALDAVASTPRSWHRALVQERIARHYERLGLRVAAGHLLSAARAGYRDWGAVGKVRRLDDAYPSLRETGPGPSAASAANSTTGLTTDRLDMMAVLRASQAISSQTEPARLHAVLADQLRALTGAADVRLLVPDESQDWRLMPFGTHGDDLPSHPDADAGTSVDDPAASRMVLIGAFRYVERARQAVVVADALRDDRFRGDPFLDGLTRCSLLAVPVLSAGTLRAVLVLTNPHTRGVFTADRLTAVDLIAGQLAVSLDNAALYRSLETRVATRTRNLEAARRQLELLSLTDTLTETWNRRHFDTALRGHWSITGRPLSVLMIDIDHFKSFNDLNGHPAGDACIRAVAAQLSEGLREDDIVCRYGGEEFAVILPDVDAGTAGEVAERLRLNVSALGLPHPRGGTVSVSIGVATTTPDGSQDPGPIVAAADTALYEAKRAGRNRSAAARTV